MPPRDVALDQIVCQVHAMTALAQSDSWIITLCGCDTMKHGRYEWNELTTFPDNTWWQYSSWINFMLYHLHMVNTSRWWIVYLLVGDKLCVVSDVYRDWEHCIMVLEGSGHWGKMNTFITCYLFGHLVTWCLQHAWPCTPKTRPEQIDLQVW
jgi:hypothetical protein